MIAEVDAGEPVIQREVDMRQGETLEQLEDRIHVVEHQAIVDGTKHAIERLRVVKGSTSAAA